MNLSKMIAAAKTTEADSPKRKRILINLPSAHGQYIHAFNKILAKHLKGQVVLCKGTYTAASLIAKARLCEADAIFIACYETLENLVKEELGRSRKVSFDDWAGSVLWLDKRTPATVIFPLNVIYNRPWTEIALSKYIKKSLSLPATEPTFNWVNLNDPIYTHDILKALPSALLLSCDIETNRKFAMTCIGFTLVKQDLTTINFVLDFRMGTDSWQMDFVKQVCLSAVPKVFHNGTYDNQFLQYYGIAVNNWLLDTEYLMYCLYEELPRSLAFVSGMYCANSRYWKHTHDADLLEYNARDCEQTALACISMLQDYPDYAKTKYKTVFALTTPALYCALHGMKTRPELLATLAEKAEAEIAPLAAELNTMCGLGFTPKIPLGGLPKRLWLKSWGADTPKQEAAEINVNSPTQLKWLLYDVLGAQPVRVQGKRGAQKATDVKSLAKVTMQHPIFARFTGLIQRIRKERKAISTYFTARLWHDRLLFSYRIDGTETGRLSCKQSNFDSLGAQIQNVPAYMKEALIPDDGYELAEIDKSQAEARITAYFADDETLINALEDDKDFYKTCGTLFFGIPYEEVTKELRNKVIKRIIHGSNYMMQADTFVDTVGAVTLQTVRKDLGFDHLTVRDFAAYLLSLYHKAYPKLAPWYQDTELQLRTKGYLESPLGWRRHFFGDPTNSATLRSAVAHQPQNLNVHIVNIAMTRVFWQLVVPSEGKFCLIAQVHDSLLFQIKKGYAASMLPKAVEIMEDIPVTFTSGKSMVIPVDGHMGASWSEVK